MTAVQLNNAHAQANANSLAVTVGLTTAGTLLTAIVVSDDGSSAGRATQTGPAGWIAGPIIPFINGGIFGSNGNGEVRIWYLPKLANTGGATSFTWSCAGVTANCFMTVIYGEYSGVLDGSLDVSGVNSGSGTTESITSPSTTNADDLVIFGVVNTSSSNPEVFSLPSGYAVIDAETNGSVAIVAAGWWKEVTSTGAQSPSTTTSDSVNWISIVATFKSSASEVAVVQEAGNASTDATHNTLVTTISTTAGNVLYCWITTKGGLTEAITDSAGNTWTKISSVSLLGLWRTQGPTLAVTSVTATSVGNGTAVMSVIEVSGENPSYLAAFAGGTNNATSTAPTDTSTAARGQRLLLLACISNVFAGTNTASAFTAGWTLTPTRTCTVASNQCQLMPAYQVVTTGIVDGTTTFTFGATLGNSAAWSEVTAAMIAAPTSLAAENPNLITTVPHPQGVVRPGMSAGTGLWHTGPNGVMIGSEGDSMPFEYDTVGQLWPLRADVYN